MTVSNALIYLLGSYTPAFLYTSEAMGTVELTGLEMIPSIALGQLLNTNTMHV